MRHIAIGLQGGRNSVSVLRNAIALAFALALVLVSLPLLSPPAAAQTVSQPAPSIGCLGKSSAGVSLFNGVQTPAGGVDLNAAGPVEQVVVSWMGFDDTRSGVSSLDLTVTRPDGSTETISAPGNLAMIDQSGPGGGNLIVYSWWADITAAFGAGDPGVYNVDIEPFATPGVGLSWGSTVHVIYDTSPCEVESEVQWNIGADYYFGGGGSTPTTDTVVLTFDPSTEPRTGFLTLSHGGSDSTTSNCRFSIVWAAVGSGTPPDTVVSPDGVPIAPGATEVLIDPFTPPNQPCPPLSPQLPVVSAVGGNVGPEYAVMEVGFEIPAGATWLAIQLESPTDNDGFPGPPESGASSVGGAFILPLPVSQEVPSVALEKTVVAAGETCPGVNGVDELVTGPIGTPVTYCFSVTNTGSTHLFPVTIDDPDLGITDADMTLVSGDPTAPLAPGESIVWSYDATIQGDLTNTATTTGTPTDAEGTPTGDEPVDDDDDASVGLTAADILLEKTVLAGADQTCPGVEGVDEFVEATPALVDVTYCFRTVNTGATHLIDVSLDDPDLGITDADMTLVSGDPTAPLAPGDEIVWSYGSVITVALVNVATVTGTPADEDGQALSTTPVTDTNDAEVSDAGLVLEERAGIAIEKTVLAAGGTCPGVNGVDELVVTNATGTAVVYCFKVINTGTIDHLFPISVADPDLDITDADMTLVSGDPTAPLAPGDEIVWSYNSTITADLTNTATATGTPTDAGGVPTGAADLTDSDDARVALELPRTGSEASAQLRFALLLLLAGAALLVMDPKTLR